MSEEASEWQRIIEWPAPFQPNPRGATGSGALVPPFAWVRPTERFTKADFARLVVPRPTAPEAAPPAHAGVLTTARQAASASAIQSRDGVTQAMQGVHRHGK